MRISDWSSDVCSSDLKVVITEIGWPSEGRIRRDAVPSPTTQAGFLRAFLNVANQRGLDYFIQEAFDQPWKRNIEGSVGAYWGIYTADRTRSEEHTSELQSLMRISYAVFCLKKKNTYKQKQQ